MTMAEEEKMKLPSRITQDDCKEFKRAPYIELRQQIAISLPELSRSKP